MDILFIGGVYEKNLVQDYINKSKSGIQLAVNTHQWNIIDGIDSKEDISLSILSGVFIEEYPKYQELYKKKNIWSHNGISKDENIGFLNIFGIKQIWRTISMEHKAKLWAKKQGKDKNIICYYTNVPFMNAAIQAKKKNQQIKTTLIVSDVPGFLNLSNKQSIKSKIIYSLSMRKIKKLLNKFDNFILLTEEMKNVLDIGDRPYIVMEGLINSNDAVTVEKIKQKKIDKKVIVYSGSLHEKYGIMTLLEAFKLIKDKDYKLIIFGDGECREYIEGLQNRDSRIEYLGYQQREIVLEYQRKATVLINPRDDQGEFNKYSFPSKNLEYLISGTPVIAYKLAGMPEEYVDYINIPKGDKAIDLATTIMEVCNKSEFELKEMSIKARNFIVNEKNINKQADRIINLLRGLV